MLTRTQRAPRSWSRGQGFSIADLNASLWVRGSFVGPNTWPGTASKGSSGTRDITEPTNPPAVGTDLLKGYAPADFDGTNDKLENSSVGITTLLPPAGHSFSMLVQADAFPAIAAGNGQIFSDPNPSGGFLQVGAISSAGNKWSYSIFQAGYKTVLAAATTSVTKVQGYYDGANMYLIIDGTASAPTACGTYSSTAKLRVGGGYAGTNFFNGKIWDLALFPIVLTSTEFSKIRDYYTSRYGV